MAETSQNDGLVKKVLLHMYNSVVVGSINSLAILLRLKTPPEGTNPRYADLRELYDVLGPDGRRIFFNAAVAIAEFAVFNTLDFVETYNRFDSETNEDDFPRISFVYTDRVNGKEEHRALSTYGEHELGQEFKRTARREDFRELVSTAINNILVGEPTSSQGGSTATCNSP